MSFLNKFHHPTPSTQTSLPYLADICVFPFSVLVASGSSCGLDPDDTAPIASADATSWIFSSTLP